MSLTFHAATIPTLTRALTQLRHILDKGATHAHAQGWDPAVLLGMRLAPDMFPMVRQIQIATDVAKNAVGRLTGVEAPTFEDTETSFAELDARLQRTLDYIGSVPVAAFEGAESRSIVLSTRAYGELRYSGKGYLFDFVLPNLYFHSSVAYALLRHAGVPLGKHDFLGPMGEG